MCVRFLAQVNRAVAGTKYRHTDRHTDKHTHTHTTNVIMKPHDKTTKNPIGIAFTPIF